MSKASERAVARVKASIASMSGADDHDAWISDRLTDLRHYAEAHEANFYEALDNSYMHYLRERGEGDDLANEDEPEVHTAVPGPTAAKLLAALKLAEPQLAAHDCCIAPMGQHIDDCPLLSVRKAIAEAEGYIRRNGL